MKVAVLGAGLVGKPMALDLAADEALEVTVFDRSAAALDGVRQARSDIATDQADLSDPAAVREVVAPHDVVLSAVPGCIGFRTLQGVIEAGKPVVDIAFFPEDPFTLDELARQRGVVAVVDCGVAPGLSHMLCARAEAELDRTDSLRIDVGGLPVERRWPYAYKAVFSPRDVLAEYIRPARLVEHGQEVVRPALSEIELVDFAGLGTLESFNSDGLRTLLTTLKVPNMKEKTLRYPGHAEKMRMLRDSGFFSEAPITVAGQPVRPFDLTAELLSSCWQLQPGEPDLTVMRVVAEGEKDGRLQRIVYELSDRFDEASGTHSMARTTGYTATVVLRLLASGGYDAAGISPPEWLGRERAHLDFVRRGLADRGVLVRERVEAATDPACGEGS